MDGVSNPEKSQAQRRGGPSRQNLNSDQSGISAGENFFELANP